MMLSLLAGCSTGPDAQDLQPLLQQQVRADLDGAESAARALGGATGVEFIRALGAPDARTVQVENVKILEQRALDNGDYEVQVRYDIVAGERREIQTERLRLDETDAGWRLLPRR